MILAGLLARPVSPDVGSFTVDPETRESLRSRGSRKQSWLILVPMNNTDRDVTLTLKPDLARLGFAALAEGRLVDVFRTAGFRWQGPPGWLANAGDPEPPCITIQGRETAFPVHQGAAAVPVPRRNFRMLLLEPVPPRARPAPD